jgi:glucose-1-phosphate thymidylyltransferase
MKGIVLAGGTGSRLWPLTLATSKQLLPVYDKPMIYYPISTLMLAGIREILIISTPKDIESFKQLLGDGSKIGVEFIYAIQPEPKGIAQAFSIGEKFISSDRVALILGDNILVGNKVGSNLKEHNEISGGLIFAAHVADPERYGVVELDSSGFPISIEEKPLKPKSNLAIPGLYFYDNSVIELSKTLSPSSRDELEISDLNELFLKSNKLKVTVLPRGTVWMDAGTIDSLHKATSYIEAIENTQLMKIACLEEIAWRNNWIETNQLLELASHLGDNRYGNYLRSIAVNQKGEQ